MELAILSAGQTGVDRAALDVAWEFKLGRGGWCARGRMAEDGPIDPQYDLTETPSDSYEEAIAWNVRDSSGTLVITPADPIGEARLAVEVCRRLDKPHLVIDPLEPKAVAKSIHWISSHHCTILNVAGPHESAQPGTYARASALLREILSELTQPGGGEAMEF